MIRPVWLEIAEREARMGVDELPGDAHHPRILDYHASTKLRATADEVPWCASFVCWCLQQAGVRSTESARARSFLGWGIPMALELSWAHGAVVILRRAGLGQPGPDVLDAPGHVGFLVGQPTPREILVHGANQDDAVNVRPYPLERVLGARWPDLRR